MVTKEIAAFSRCMTPETMNAFIEYETQNGASENMIRRFRGAVKALYDWLPEDKQITRERLVAWRKELEEGGYASVTVLNYVKYVNRYLDYAGCSEIRFNRGKAKDITGMTFGYLKAIQPTGTKNRNDIVWLFECKCGKTVELPATRVLLGNTLSCGCLKGAHFKTTNKYMDGTSLTQAMTEKVESTRSVSGYTGVTPKRDKWQAYITYKGVHYSLGSYYDVKDAVKARARAKELVIADAQGLLDFYTELEKTFPKLPNRRTEPKKVFPIAEWTVNDSPASAAKRSDNTSGYAGVYQQKGKWEAKICYRGKRYRLGRFADIEDAIAARKAAEKDLLEDPLHFEEIYSKKYPYNSVKGRKISV